MQELRRCLFTYARVRMTPCRMCRAGPSGQGVRSEQLKAMVEDARFAAIFHECFFTRRSYLVSPQGSFSIAARFLWYPAPAGLMCPACTTLASLPSRLPCYPPTFGIFDSLASPSGIGSLASGVGQVSTVLGITRLSLLESTFSTSCRGCEGGR